MANQEFRGRAATWELKKSARTGVEYIEVWFDLLDFPGDRVKWMGGFGEKGYQYTFEDMRKCGWDGASTVDLDSLLTNEVALVLEEHEYQGNVTQQVKYINEPGSVRAGGQFGDAEKATFKQKMAGKLAQWHAQKGTKPPAQAAKRAPAPPPPARDERPPIGDDDIPF